MIAALHGSAEQIDRDWQGSRERPRTFAKERETYEENLRKDCEIIVKGHAKRASDRTLYRHPQIAGKAKLRFSATTWS